MGIDPAAPPQRPPSFNRHNNLTDENHHRLLESSSAALIALPIGLIILALAVVSLILLIYLRTKSKTTSSFRKESVVVDDNHLSKSSSSLNGSSIGYSPNVRNCIYGGRLVCTPQARSRRGQVFTYRELEEASNGFSRDNVIGNGGFGVVFRGTLSDGTIAAIKVLQRDGKQGEREFRTEVDVLSRLHSRYLVGLLGYCADQQHRLLVFEFMPNGSLQGQLHPPPHNRSHHQPLDWWTRLAIALDCARGLEFLHEHSTPSVIHRDFKCSNILLDHNYRAKVSDLGMASDKINGQIRARVFGTTGYIAPEYASTGKLTTKSDVYSYGVVLLQLLTGRVPVDITRPSGEHVLVSWALPRLTNRDKVTEMVDPALQGQFSKKELIQIAAIAAVCVQSEPDYRPLITDVVQSLIPLVKGHATPSRSEHHIVIPATVHSGRSIFSCKDVEII